MHKTCPVCQVHLEPEPGFYIGAMYVGYAFTVAIITTVSLGLYLFGGSVSYTTYMVANIGATILLAPLNFRYSRVLFLYWFGGL